MACSCKKKKLRKVPNGNSKDIKDLGDTIKIEIYDVTSEE